MKRIFISLAFVALSMLFFHPAYSQAESCACFCKSSGGAIDQGFKTEVSDCQDVCGADFLGCYKDDPVTEDVDESLSQRPQFNTLCWTQEECESSELEGMGGGDWDGQASFCIPGEGLCYPAPVPVTLNVAIAGLTEARTFGQYINAMYSFVLTAASLLAVVMLMLGGIQYMLARGNQTSLGKARKRISNAVVGLILLFSTYAIANLIDPNFTTFNRLGVPRIRTVVFLDKESTCEFMTSAGISIEPQVSGAESCGNKGEVIDLNGVQTTTGIVVGAECVYDTCGDEMETCMQKEDESYLCVRCGNAHGYDVPVSQTTCSRLTGRESNANEYDLYYCEYDAGWFDIGLVYTGCTEIVYPKGNDSLDCKQLQHNASVGGSQGCRAYDLVYGSYLPTTFFDFGDPTMSYKRIDDIKTAGDGQYAYLSQICESDPCNLAPPGESCEAKIVAIDDADYVLLALMGTIGLALAEVADGMIVNCANESSDYGLRNCKDWQGNVVDCNWTW